MSYENKLVVTSFLNGLYAAEGIYNQLNRSFDGLVRGSGATSVDIPKNPNLSVSTSAVAHDSASRKKALADTSMVNVPFVTYTVPVAEEVEAQFANPQLIQNFVNDAIDAMTDKIDADVLTEAADSIPAGQKINMAGGVLAWKDIVKAANKFTTNRVSRKKDKILVAVPSALEEQFKDLEIVKQAMSTNKDLLEQGVAVIDKMNFVISADVPQVGGKDALLFIYKPGIAVIIKDMMNRKVRYDESTRKDIIDYNSYIAIKKLRTEFANALLAA